MDATHKPLLASLPLGPPWFGMPVRLSLLAICVCVSMLVRYYPDASDQTVRVDAEAPNAQTPAAGRMDTGQMAAGQTDESPVAGAGPVGVDASALHEPNSDSVNPGLEAGAASTAVLREDGSDSTFPATAGRPVYLGLILAVLFLVSVTFHELIEAAVTRQQDGHVAAVVILPGGGAVVGAPPPTFLGEMAAAGVGPLFHAVVCVLCCPALLVRGDTAGAFNPLALPAVDLGAGWLSGLGVLLFSLNWSLLWLSLLPITPLDGSRLVRAWWVDTRGRSPHSELKWCLWGLFSGLTLVSVGLSTGNVWLVLLGGMLMLTNAVDLVHASAGPERDEESPFGYDFSEGYTSLEGGFDDEEDEHAEREPGGWLTQWRERREARRRDQEAAERGAAEAELDRLLEKISRSGMDSLTAEEKRTLKRLSTRFKSRG